MPILRQIGGLLHGPLQRFGKGQICASYDFRWGKCRYRKRKGTVLSIRGRESLGTFTKIRPKSRSKSSLLCLAILDGDLDSRGKHALRSIFNSGTHFLMPGNQLDRVMKSQQTLICLQDYGAQIYILGDSNEMLYTTTTAPSGRSSTMLSSSAGLYAMSIYNYMMP